MGVLTIADLINLHFVLETAQQSAKVAILLEGNDQPMYGVARSIGDEKGNFLRDGVDVRDGFLRITSRSGWEYFIPVEELAKKHRTGEFTKYDWA